MVAHLYFRLIRVTELLGWERIIKTNGLPREVLCKALAQRTQGEICFVTLKAFREDKEGHNSRAEYGLQTRRRAE